MGCSAGSPVVELDRRAAWSAGGAGRCRADAKNWGGRFCGGIRGGAVSVLAADRSLRGHECAPANPHTRANFRCGVILVKYS